MELAPITALDGVTTEITEPAYRDILMEMPQPEGGEAPAPPGFLGGNGLLDDELIDRLVAYRRDFPASVVFLRSLGGAFGDIAQDETAFPARTATWFVMAGAFDVPGMLDADGREKAAADAQRIVAGRLAEYSNFVDAERSDAVSGMYDRGGYERLRAVKAQWDPRNVFRRNHNILV